MEKTYYLTYKGVKIPYEFTSNFTTIILNKNRKDYSDQVNIILKKKYPKLKYIQHHSYYTDLNFYIDDSELYNAQWALKKEK